MPTDIWSHFIQQELAIQVSIAAGVIGAVTGMIGLVIAIVSWRQSSKLAQLGYVATNYPKVVLAPLVNYQMSRTGSQAIAFCVLRFNVHNLSAAIPASNILIRASVVLCERRLLGKDNKKRSVKTLSKPEIRVQESLALLKPGDQEKVGWFNLDMNVAMRYPQLVTKAPSSGGDAMYSASSGPKGLLIAISAEYTPGVYDGKRLKSDPQQFTLWPYDDGGHLNWVVENYPDERYPH